MIKPSNVSQSARIIVFSQPIVALRENRFFITGEDLDGKQWDIAGPIEDINLPSSVRLAHQFLADGWAYLDDIKGAMQGYTKTH